ncbi:MAG: aminoacyl-tRNA hydrolase [Candidatus Promineifilaceae bacterium]|jgi:PTH1 family peptidyl-tRNA hydrolase
MSLLSYVRGIIQRPGENVPKLLIVGLGNPGLSHSKNRHNIGFMAVDSLAESFNIELKRKKHNAVFGTGQIAEQPVILIKPQTFMNRSGRAVGKVSAYYDVQPGETVIIYDEIDLPFGTLRIREKGGSGGHNGMKSVIQEIGQDFPRIRLGVGRPPGRMDPADYVLSDFRPEELPVVEEMISNAMTAIEIILTDGVELAMTHLNGEAKSSNS